MTTQPQFAFYFDDVGWGVENYGFDPNIEMDITPQDYINGEDHQLSTAIDEILKVLIQNPCVKPDFSECPTKSLPKLPNA